MKPIITAFVMIFLLAACGSSNDNPQSEANTPTDNGLPQLPRNFTVAMRGDRSASFEGPGVFQCSDGNGTLTQPRYQTINMLDADERMNTIVINMPALAAPGVYPLESQQSDNYGAVYSVEVYLNRSESFVVVQDGTLTLDSVPTGAGQPVKGNIQATLTTDDGAATITIDANFDFTSLTEEEIALTGINIYCSS